MGSLTDRTRLSQALYDIDLRIHANLSPDEIMQSALDGFVAALRADAGDIKVLEDGEWVVCYQQGFDASDIGLRLSAENAPVAVRVATSGEPVTIEDYWAEPEDFFVGFPKARNLRATLAVPLVIRDEVVGCLFAWMRAERRAFSSDEIDFGRHMAASLALALENAQLLEAEQSARTRAESAEARLAEELSHTRLLLRASDELASATDSTQLLERLSNIVLEATGISRAFVNLVDTDRQLLTPKVPHGGLQAPGGMRIPFERLSKTARSAISAGRTAILDYDVPNLPEQDKKIAAANRARLVLFVPLLYKGQVVGHVALDEPGERHDFSDSQIRIVESICAQAAVMLQNLRLYEREHRVAETLQQALLEPPMPVQGLDIGFVYQPAYAVANVGGDFYDVFELGGSRVALLVGDISGKGAEAAKLTALVRDATRAYLFEGLDPCTTLTRVNALMHRFTATDKFATAFLGLLDVQTGALHYCSAGHPGPVVMQGEQPRTLPTQPGLIGAFADAQFETAETALATGDRLVLFTDGITEARVGSKMLGEDGVREVLCRIGDVPAGDTPRLLLTEALSYAGVLRDDVAILCVARVATQDTGA